MIWISDIYCRLRKGQRWSHLMTDGYLDELHEFGRTIGLKRSWFQGKTKIPHYDISPRKRELAILWGGESGRKDGVEDAIW